MKITKARIISTAVAAITVAILSYPTTMASAAFLPTDNPSPSPSVSPIPEPIPTTVSNSPTTSQPELAPVLPSPTRLTVNPKPKPSHTINSTQPVIQQPPMSQPTNDPPLPSPTYVSK